MRRFVADAAHELRTPIAGIAAATEAVLAQPSDGDPEARQRLLMALGREAHRAGKLVDDLLDLARIDTGLSLQPERTDIRGLVDAQVEHARLLHPQLLLSVEGPSVTFAVDPLRIGQVLANLLSNACRVTPAGAAVRVTVWPTGQEVRVTVSDSVRGGARASRPHLRTTRPTRGCAKRPGQRRRTRFADRPGHRPCTRRRRHLRTLTSGQGAVFVLTIRAAAEDPLKNHRFATVLQVRSAAPCTVVTCTPMMRSPRRPCRYLRRSTISPADERWANAPGLHPPLSPR